MESKIVLSPIPLSEYINLIQNVVRAEIRSKITDDLQEKLLSPKETAKLFLPPVSLVTLDAWAEKGLITKHYLGGRVYYRYSEIIESVTKIKKYARRLS